MLGIKFPKQFIFTVFALIIEFVDLCRFHTNLYTKMVERMNFIISHIYISTKIATTRQTILLFPNPQNVFKKYLKGFFFKKIY
jgi:hypothetical protein